MIEEILFFFLIRESRRILLLIFGGMKRITISLELGENPNLKRARNEAHFPPY